MFFCTFETLLVTISLKLRVQMIVQTSEAQSGARVLNLYAYLWRTIQFMENYHQGHVDTLTTKIADFTLYIKKTNC